MVCTASETEACTLNHATRETGVRKNARFTGASPSSGCSNPAPRHQEEPAEWKQRLPIGTPGVGLADPLCVDLEQAFCVGTGGIEQGLERCPARPLHHRVFSLEDLQVFGLPQLE